MGEQQGAQLAEDVLVNAVNAVLISYGLPAPLPIGANALEDHEIREQFEGQGNHALNEERQKLIRQLLAATEAMVSRHAVSLMTRWGLPFGGVLAVEDLCQQFAVILMEHLENLFVNLYRYHNGRGVEWPTSVRRTLGT